MCQPSSLQSKLRSTKTRLNWLQTVIDGQESRLDTSFYTRRAGSSQFASDETLSRTACLEQRYPCKPTRSVDQLREVCPSPALRFQAHCPDDVRLDTSSASVQEAETNVTSERQRLHGEGGKGHDCRGRGTEASKEEADHKRRSCTTPCTTLERHPVHREFSTPPSPRFSPKTRRWRLFVVSILQAERMRIRRETALMMEEDL